MKRSAEFPVRTRLAMTFEIQAKYKSDAAAPGSATSVTATVLLRLNNQHGWPRRLGTTLRWKPGLIAISEQLVRMENDHANRVATDPVHTTFSNE